MSDPILSLRNVAKSFGGFKAVDQVDMEVPRGSITGLIGPNGAGKTTLFNIIAGLIKPDTGTISLNGRPIHGLQPHLVYRAGLARTFQIPRPFHEMTVLENIMLAPLDQAGEQFWNNWINRGTVASQEREIQARAEEIIAFTNLTRVAHDPAKTLSGGQMKLLELARALMRDPQIILLDEPGAGVNPALMNILIDKIKEINERGHTFLIIEHNMDVVMNICDPIVALAQGRVIFTGNAKAAADDADLLDVYLGEPVS